MIQFNPMAAEPIAATTETCPACGTVIDTTEADPLSRVPCPKCGEKVRVQRSFDNFELVETLGIGGMGTVYKARDTLLDRLVALKSCAKTWAKKWTTPPGCSRRRGWPLRSIIRTSSRFSRREKITANFIWS